MVVFGCGCCRTEVLPWLWLCSSIGAVFGGSIYGTVLLVSSLSWRVCWKLIGVALDRCGDGIWHCVGILLLVLVPV
jgi:hypothetical protein